ncbi:MAG TPA: hypothetical protein VMW50_08690 [Dehalococcoidia bacterium]|nr:hypothetical protein [Dehalococcoidia bacterium]
MINAEPVTKEEIILSLKEQLRNEGIAHSHVGLPKDIDFSSYNGVLRARVSIPALNMQVNSVAFEGWVVALKTWLPDLTTKVELDFPFPSDYSVGVLGNSKACHFNRFLYRTANFLRLFPDWFSLYEVLREKVEEFGQWLKKEPCYLNQPLRERKSVPKTKNIERKIESWFTFEEGKELLCECWGLNREKLFNQLPVGVFHKTIEKKTAIFTRGAAAIDLGGISEDGKTLHIIELKSGNNINMGVISETLFYTAVIHDTCIAMDNLFKFGRYKRSRQTEAMIIIQNGGRKFEHLHSHILAERYHPLFSHDVMNLLASGLSRLGIKFDRAKYDYKNRRLLA